MAKSKSFFGLRRGSTKSLTFQVLDGQQITKDRVTEVKNPRSNGQLVQRAIMATVMQAYSQGKAIFDHAFQGKSVGAANQREFMRLNANALRAAIANDINNGNGSKATALGRVVAPGAKSPVPFSYIISQGSYDQNLFVTDLVTGEPSAYMPIAETNQTVAAYCAAHNIVPGDIYTIVAFAASDTETYDDSSLGELASTPRCNFGFIRLIVKPGVLADEIVLTNPGQIFTQDNSKGTIIDLSQRAIDERWVPGECVSNPDLNVGAIGVIRSREDADLRSNTTMIFANSFGITADYIVPIWKAGTTKIGNSDLILEGGNF